MNEQEKRELLVRLAENVMGWEPFHHSTQQGDYVWAEEYSEFWLKHCPPRSWSPLENIADAWMLVEALRPKAMLALSDIDGMWQAKFCGRADAFMTGESWKANHESECLAICLAADAATRNCA